MTADIQFPEQSDIDALTRRVTALEARLREQALAAVAELRRLSVRRDDTIVVTVAGPMTDEHADRLRDAVRRVTGHTRVLVVGDLAEISVAERAS